MPMPAASAALGWPGRQRLAEDLDGALVGHVVPEEDAHQRALAGAVFTQQRQHLAPRQVERDGVIGHQRCRSAW
jgi:hypothetical protein